MIEPVLVSVGGGLGAVCRYLVGQFVGERRFPWATLVVNVVGSFLLGLVVFGVSDSEIALLVGTGFCGAFTTFSSFSFQTVGLWERGDKTHALLNAAGNLAVSLAGFAGAWVLVG